MAGMAKLRLWWESFRDDNAFHEAAMDIDHGRTPRRPLNPAPPARFVAAVAGTLALVLAAAAAWAIF